MPANYRRKTNRPYTERGTHPVDRFFGYVPVRGRGCWLWQGYRKPSGYGVFNLDGKTMHAHRASYILSHDEDGLPDGIRVCHRCDNPQCVRPDHLFLGTHADNMRDGKVKGVWIGRGGKLTPAQRNDIRRRRSSESLSKLADEFGVSRTAIIKTCRVTGPSA